MSDSTTIQDTPEVKEIPANNPTPEEMAELKQALESSYAFSVNVKPTIFHFKKQRQTYKDDDGKDIVIETKRQSLSLPIPYPTVQGIVAILEAGGKQRELLISAVEDVVTAQARSLINDDADYKLDASNFPYDKLSWEFIANIPKATRRGGGIPKETMEEFAADYIEVMPVATGKSVEQVQNAAKLMLGRFNQVKNRPDAEPVLKLLIEQLAIYAENSPNIADYQEVVDYLLSRAESLLDISPEELLNAL